MIDLPLMAKLVDAGVADGTRLVLLGDPDQLPSVEAGDVLAAILGAAGDGDTLAHDDAAALHPLLGEPAGRHPAKAGIQHLSPHSPASACTSSAAGARAKRCNSRRSPPRCATTCRYRARPAARRRCRTCTSTGASPIRSTRAATHCSHWRSLAWRPRRPMRSPNPRLRLLYRRARGPQGAYPQRTRIERLLVDNAAGTRGGPGHFHGQLLIVTENSLRHRLFNGDIGLCLRDEDGVLVMVPR